MRAAAIGTSAQGERTRTVRPDRDPAAYTLAELDALTWDELQDLAEAVLDHEHALHAHHAEEEIPMPGHVEAQTKELWVTYEIIRRIGREKFGRQVRPRLD